MAYEVLKKETLYKGHIFSVDQVEMTLPDAKVHKYDTVILQNAVTILPLDDEKNVLFVRQFRVGANSFLLELPAGKMETREGALATAEREIREEIGMAAQKMQPLGNYYVSPGYSTEYMYTYLATGLYSAPLAPDADEFLHVVKVPLTQAVQMIRNGEIADCKTLATFMLALPYLAQPK